MGPDKGKRTRARAWVLAMVAMVVSPASALAVDGAMSYPIRGAVAELTEFSVCELDAKTEAPRSACIPARVPGDVFTALMESGRIEDPYRDENSKDAQWVDERAWRWETTFDYARQEGKRARLLFMGVDYISRIEVNGRVLHQQEGMFSRIDLDVTDYLNDSGRQKLTVVLFGVPTTNWEWLGPVLSSNEFGRKQFLKTQMSFDWDFAPRLKGCGLWDRVYLYETGAARITDVFVKAGMDGKAVIEIELAGGRCDGCEIEVSIKGESFDMEAPITASAPVNQATGAHTVTINVPSPRLWWPWDLGEQNLYRVRARVLTGGLVSDEASEVFGFREITWGPNDSPPPGSADWVLFINGKREFMRGANWVPPEAMYGRLEDARYGKIVGMAKDAGINMIRMWGGGNRERRAFYDYCDRAGVLVWQEYPFACVYLSGYPRTQAFKDLTRQEVEEITRQLRNHASLFMWCGGNEFNVKQNMHVVKIMEETVARLDPTRRFIPASPYKGDTHNWVVWHTMGNLSNYFEDISPLPSEFGLQAFSDVSTYEKWLSPENLYPLGPVHSHHDLGKGKMMKYAKVLEPEDNFESLVDASQTMQAHYYQRGIENWRQRKYKTSGAAFWQLNEPWPSINWSVIDYELEPKKSYEALINTYNPVLITAAFEDRKWEAGDRFEAEVMVVNDLHQSYPSAEVTATLCGVEVGRWTVDVSEDSVAKVAVIDEAIPASCAKPELSLLLTTGARPPSQNLYHLWIHDPAPAPKLFVAFERLFKFIQSGAWGPKGE